MFELSYLEDIPYDSIISVCRQKRLLWHIDEGYAKPINYNPRKRQREQEWNGLIVENGCFFLTTRSALLNSHCRMSGRIGLYEMAPENYIQADEGYDWLLLETILMDRMKNGFGGS